MSAMSPDAVPYSNIAKRESETDRQTHGGGTDPASIEPDSSEG